MRAELVAVGNSGLLLVSRSGGGLCKSTQVRINVFYPCVSAFDQISRIVLETSSTGASTADIKT